MVIKNDAMLLDLNLNTKTLYLSEPVLGMNKLFSGKLTEHDKEFTKCTMGFAVCKYYLEGWGEKFSKMVS